MIRLLLRPLAFLLAIWLFCYFFYSLGKRKAFQDSGRRSEQDAGTERRRKYVRSTPIEKAETESKNKS